MNTELPEIKFALDAVRQASLLVRTVQTEMVSPASTKDDRSPVTVADYASQALVAFLLEKAFADDPLVAEEDASGLRTDLGGASAGDASLLGQVTRFASRRIPQASPAAVCDWIDRGAAEPAARFWTLDPIDGTKGFLRGDQYAVALALLEGGQVQLGILGCPNLAPGKDAAQPLVADIGGAGLLILAARGQGAWLTSLEKPGDFQDLHVSDIREPREARLLRSFEAGHTNVDQIDELAGNLGIQARAVRMDSQAKYAVLAAGMGDLMLRLLSPAKPHYREKIWDQAAGSLVVQEAGGRVTDLDGKPLDFTAGRTLSNNRGVLASNSRLHQPALDALRGIRA